jgi:hypothetical protein
VPRGCPSPAGERPGCFGRFEGDPLPVGFSRSTGFHAGRFVYSPPKAKACQPAPGSASSQCYLGGTDACRCCGCCPPDNELRRGFQRPAGGWHPGRRELSGARSGTADVVIVSNPAASRGFDHTVSTLCPWHRSPLLPNDFPGPSAGAASICLRLGLGGPQARLPGSRGQERANCPAAGAPNWARVQGRQVGPSRMGFWRGPTGFSIAGEKLDPLHHDRGQLLNVRH